MGILSFISGPSPDVSIINAAETFEVAVPQAGSYTFEFNYFDCSSSVQAELTYLEEDNPACITGIRDIDFNQKFSIAPNPAVDYTEVKFEIQKSEHVEITLTTLEGKVVSKEKHHFAYGEQIQRIGLDGLEPGAYLIALVGQSFKTSQLLIKN